MLTAMGLMRTCFQLRDGDASCGTAIIQEAIACLLPDLCGHGEKCKRWGAEANLLQSR